MSSSAADPPAPAVSVRAACQLNESARLIVYAGRPASDRALPSVVAALADLPRYHLAIVVADADLEELQAFGGDRVHVVTAPSEALSAFLASADIGVVGFEYPVTVDGPDALAAYRQARIGIVAADVRVIRETVGRTGAEFFTPGDPSSFLDAVKRAMRAQSVIWRGLQTAKRRGIGLARVTKRARAQRVPLVKAVRTAMQPRPNVIGEPRQSPEPPPWRPLGSAPIRLGLGLANHAGQLSAFAEAICRERLDVSAELVMARAGTPFMYPADVHMDPQQQALLEVQLAQATRVLGSYTHLIADAFRPVLGWLNGRHIEHDLPALSRAAVRVALLAHGSEVREPSRHRQRYEHSMFLDAPADVVPKLTALSAQSRRVAEESGLPVFVTTPDLLTDLPSATWAPLVVDVDRWATDAKPMQRQRPLVIHAPSRRWTKGTDRILPVVQDLADRGIIEFRLIEGVPWNKMVDLITGADIVIDQLVMGSYCALACEAMAAGKPVIAFLDEQVHERLGVRPPIVNATPATLRVAIDQLLSDRDGAVELGLQGIQYVREYHDGRRTAEAFRAFLS
jgi:glycosyltransferase involved in cell wall biosynthesis